MRNYNEFMFINYFNQLLIKKLDRIHNINVKTIV